MRLVKKGKGLVALIDLLYISNGIGKGYTLGKHQQGECQKSFGMNGAQSHFAGGGFAILHDDN